MSLALYLSRVRSSDLLDGASLTEIAGSRSTQSASRERRRALRGQGSSLEKLSLLHIPTRMRSATKLLAPTRWLLLVCRAKTKGLPNKGCTIAKLPRMQDPQHMSGRALNRQTSEAHDDPRTKPPVAKQVPLGRLSAPQAAQLLLEDLVSLNAPSNG